MTIALELIALPFLLAFLTALYAVPGVAIAHFGWGHYRPVRKRHLLVMPPIDPSAGLAIRRR